MKVLIAADIFPPQAGGPATYAVALANALHTQGDEVRILSLNPDGDTTKTRNVHHVTRRNMLRYIEYFFMLWKRAVGADLIYAMGPVNAGLPAMIVAKLRRKKFIVKVVGDYAWEQGTQRFGVLDGIDAFQGKSTYRFQVRIFKWIESFVVRHADHVIVPSQYLKKIVTGWGAWEKHISVVYNSVEIPQEVERRAQGDPDAFTLISVARLVPWKGMHMLIDVVHALQEEYSNIRLNIVGDGPIFADLKRKTEELKLTETVQLLGSLPREETLSHIASADCFILNSGYEGLSHVLLEAMMLGTYVLASDKGGNPELISMANSGRIFAYNDHASLKATIREMIVHKDSLTYPDSDFHKTFAFDHMIAQTRKTLQDVCNS